MRSWTAVLIAATLLVLPMAAHADGGAPRSSAYSRALGDLEEADALLQVPDAGHVQIEQQACDGEVRHAIRELSRASHASLKSDTAASGTPLRHDRLRHVRELLSGALKELQPEERRVIATSWGSLVASRLRHAVKHIDSALAEADANQ